jgi:hypothetical protein
MDRAASDSLRVLVGLAAEFIRISSTLMTRIPFRSAASQALSILPRSPGIGDCVFTNQVGPGQRLILRPSCYVSAGLAVAVAGSSDLPVTLETEGTLDRNQPFLYMTLTDCIASVSPTGVARVTLTTRCTLNFVCERFNLWLKQLPQRTAAM